MKEKKIPLRMCLGCREMKPKKELLRVVRPPEGEVALDPTGRRPGRGAYVCKSAECLQKAIKQRQIERAFDVKLSEDTQRALAEALEEMKGAP